MGLTIGNKGITFINDKSKIAKSLEMSDNYAGPVTHCINTFNFPWILINEDPRYVPSKTRDIINREIEVLSQINIEKKTKMIKGYFEDSKIILPVIMKFKYAGIEKMFLTDKKKIDFTNPNYIKVDNNIYKKQNNFIITLNGSDDRFSYIKEWVLNFNKDTIIYGKWSNKLIKGYESNFVEKGIIEIEDKMWESKFTFVPCFEKRLTNFVTQKVWKMIYYGIIPFWDRNSYDTDNIYKEIPDYFKVESPKEMWDKIHYLNENPEEYKKYLKIYYNLLEDKYFNGDFIVETFEKYLKF